LGVGFWDPPPIRSDALRVRGDHRQECAWLYFAPYLCLCLTTVFRRTTRCT
jgi:hypothetical protein